MEVEELEVSTSAEKDKRTKYSDWMSQLPPDLLNKPLYELAIPGSHDSMSYNLDINSPIVEPDLLKPLSKLRWVCNIVRRWAVTQEKTIAEQLDAGVRYFDLRVAHKPHDSDPTRLYFYHGLCTCTDVETILKVINEWAERHPKELLILALSHFKGVSEKVHTHLIKFIIHLFGSKLIHRKMKHPFPTLKTCWDKKRNVIISYDYPENQHVEIWGRIPYYYGNSMDPAKVESKLQKVLEKRPPHSFFVCGLNLTLPENCGILRYILCHNNNLVNVIQRSLPRLVLWLKQQAAAKTHPNIVASDLVTRDDFVSTVVKLNSVEA